VAVNLTRYDQQIVRELVAATDFNLDTVLQVSMRAGGQGDDAEGVDRLATNDQIVRCDSESELEATSNVTSG
jgi:hypothetical protein